MRAAKIKMLQIRNIERVLKIGHGVSKEAIGKCELPPQGLKVSGINRSLGDARKRTHLNMHKPFILLDVPPQLRELDSKLFNELCSCFHAR
jgi:hypothetical protein